MAGTCQACLHLLCLPRININLDLLPGSLPLLPSARFLLFVLPCYALPVTPAGWVLPELCDTEGGAGALTSSLDSQVLPLSTFLIPGLS